MIKETFLEISNNFKSLAQDSSKVIEEASQIMINSIENGGKIIFCGNGGSAADSQHLAAELIGRYRKNRDPLPAIALTTDSSIITAVANDFSFEDIFKRQIRVLGQKNDVLYAISTSGKSKNIIKAIHEAKSVNMKVIGVTGEKSHHMSGICDILINVPSSRADRIQEMHIAVGQILCEIIENKFFN